MKTSSISTTGNQSRKTTHLGQNKDQRDHPALAQIEFSIFASHSLLVCKCANPQRDHSYPTTKSQKQGQLATHHHAAKSLWQQQEDRRSV
ncbi:Uncharacterized protein DAT39_006716 [Clarias magur]|uniref:Uncharacterized protein n=1 Tax=Clarias magur TaxID=1594786 RepID=A0A8J4URK3_CLAMG|nr:Uncharacterized protein DAT39_006716 [Clarias magur]